MPTERYNSNLCHGPATYGHGVESSSGQTLTTFGEWIMTRRWCAFILLCVSHGTCFSSAVADPDHSIVRAVIDSGKAQVFAGGYTRFDLVGAMYDGLRECDIVASGITVGPWNQLPPHKADKADVADKAEGADRFAVTLLVSNVSERGKKTAYVGVTPDASFEVIAAIARRLKTCGVTDVRLCSDKTMQSQVLPGLTPLSTYLQRRQQDGVRKSDQANPKKPRATQP